MHIFNIFHIIGMYKGAIVSICKFGFGSTLFKFTLVLSLLLGNQYAFREKLFSILSVKGSTLKEFASKEFLFAFLYTRH